MRDIDQDIDTAIAIARSDDAILTTFGDMMRVPGGKQSLMEVRAEGSDIRIVYSPLDSLKIAKDNPGKKVVFFSADSRRQLLLPPLLSLRLREWESRTFFFTRFTRSCRPL